MKDEREHAGERRRGRREEGGVEGWARGAGHTVSDNN